MALDMRPHTTQDARPLAALHSGTEASSRDRTTPWRRRDVVRAAAATAVPFSAWAGPVVAVPRAEECLPTRLIDSRHPEIVSAAAVFTAGALSSRERAVRIHDAVRDRIKFGIAPAFYDMPASQVLKAGVGYCNTKTTLFSALLRAVGLPTRIRMVDLSANVLRGLFSPGTDTVDHAITEVYIDSAWCPVDSYVVDLGLARSARQRLMREGRETGYGIHLFGQSHWDGVQPAFIQGVPTQGNPPNIAREWGTFLDIEDFYNRVPDARNRLTWFRRWMIQFGAPGIHRNIETIRAQGLSTSG